MIEDKKMVQENEWKDTVLVGFLNEKIEENMEIYKKEFDIVLTEADATFDKFQKCFLN